MSSSRLAPHTVHVFMTDCWSPSCLLRWHAWLGTIVDTRNLFSRFTCLSSIPHGGGGCRSSYCCLAQRPWIVLETDQWEQMTLHLVD